MRTLTNEADKADESVPMVPTFSPNVFVPLPLPQRPANIVPKPSIPIPRLIA